MRINIYSQELTKEVTLVRKRASDSGADHVGIRMFMASPDILSFAADDDDRSAVTFWIPNCGSFTNDDLAHLFSEMSEMIRTAEMPARK